MRTWSLFRRPRNRTLRGEARTAWLMSAPSLLLLAMFLVLPLALGAYYSLTNARLISPLPTQFLGLANFDQLLSVTAAIVEPQVNPATGTPQRDAAGALVYPRTR